MASLVLDFSDIYTRVSDFLGLGTSPTGDDLTKVKDITYRGYRRFLFPFDTASGRPYIWSFLRKTGTLSTGIGKHKYTLPSEFVGLVSGFKFDAGEDKANPQRIDISKLRGLRSVSTTAGTPKYYAIAVSPYDTETGIVYETWFHRPPDAVYNYKYEYIFDPDKPTETTDVFVGGIRASEVILQCAIAIAELQEDDIAGPQEAKAGEMLRAYIEYDKIYLPNAVEIDPDISLSIPNFRRERLMRPAAGGIEGG